MELTYILPLLTEGGFGILLAVVIVLVIVPSMKHMRTITMTLQRQTDLLEQIAAQTKENIDLSRQIMATLFRVQNAIKIAYIGRSNGHTEEEAKKHYEMAAELLTDDEDE